MRTRQCRTCARCPRPLTCDDRKRVFTHPPTTTKHHNATTPNRYNIQTPNAIAPHDTCAQDSEVMVQVERDVMRTHPDMHFFTGDSPEAEAHREVRGEEGRGTAWWSRGRIWSGGCVRARGCKAGGAPSYRPVLHALRAPFPPRYKRGASSAAGQSFFQAPSPALPPSPPCLAPPPPGYIFASSQSVMNVPLPLAARPPPLPAHRT